MPDRPAAPADLVLLGGRCAPWSPAAPLEEALAVRDGRMVAVGRDEDVRDHPSDRGRAWWNSAGGPSRPGFQDAHIHPMEAGLEALRCDLHDRRGLDTYLARDRRLRGDPSRRGVDHGRRLGARRLSGRHAACRGSRPGRFRPAGFPSEQGRPRRVGEQPRPRAGRHYRLDLRPARRPHRTRPGRHADRERCTRVRRSSWND